MHPSAQRKVPLPDGLDLDAMINEEESDRESESEPEEASASPSENSSDSEATAKRKRKDKRRKDRERDEKKKDKDRRRREDRDAYATEDYDKKASAEEIAAAKARQEQIKASREHDPYYIGDLGGKKLTDRDVDDIPMRRIEDDDLPPIGEHLRLCAPCLSPHTHACTRTLFFRVDAILAIHLGVCTCASFDLVVCTCAEVNGEEDIGGKKKKKNKVKKPPKKSYVVAAVMDAPEGVDLDEKEVCVCVCVSVLSWWSLCLSLWSLFSARAIVS